MRTVPALALASTFALTLTISLTALAAPEGATCTTNADCDGNLTCELTGATGCTAPACAPGETCDVPACETVEDWTCVAPPCQNDADCGPGLRCAQETSESCTDCAAPSGAEVPDCGGCTTETYTACVPKLCAADADCGDPGLVCIQESWESCSGEAIACAVGEECPPPPPPVCGSESVSFCGPKYLGSCDVATDCGDGFDCVPEESCGCAGSAGVAEPSPSDPSIDPPVEPPVEDCTCEPTGTNYCEPQEIPCPNGTECPTDWTCEPGIEMPVTCGPGVECPAPDPAVPMCMPPLWRDFAMMGESGADGSASTSDPTLAEMLDAPAADPADAPQAAGDATSSSNDSGGCSVASPGGSVPTAWGVLALLGLAFAGRRRRR